MLHIMTLEFCITVLQITDLPSSHLANSVHARFLKSIQTPLELLDPLAMEKLSCHVHLTRSGSMKCVSCKQIIACVKRLVSFLSLAMVRRNLCLSVKPLQLRVISLRAGPGLLSIPPLSNRILTVSEKESQLSLLGIVLSKLSR